MSEENSNKIKIFNFIFTLLIVVYHLRGIYSFNIQYNNAFDEKILKSFLEITDKLGFAAMSFFFMMSGFLFYKNINNEREATNKIKKRLKTLIIPYFAWNFLTILLEFILFKKKPILSVKYIAKILFFSPVNGPSWYLIALFIISCFSPLIIKFKKNEFVFILLLLSSFMLVNLYGYGIIPRIISQDIWWWLSNMIGYIPAYLIGAYLGLFKFKKVCEIDNNVLANIIGGILLAFPFVFENLFKSMVSHSLIAYIIIPIGFWCLCRKSMFKRKANICNCSFYIYLLHQPILIPQIDNIFLSALNNKPVSGIGFINIRFAELLLVIIISFVIWKISKKILNNKIERIFSGERG